MSNEAADLMEEGAVREREEIESLYREHNESLLRFLALKLGSQQEARDVAQEAYVKILGLDQKGVINHLRAYLFRTANNLAINRLKQRVRRKEAYNVDVGDINLTDERARVEQAVDARERIKRLEEIVLQLPPKCRMAFLLYKLECMEYADIAKRMKISESMVRKYVLQAVRYCHDKLGAIS